MEYQTIILRRNGGIAEIILNRPPLNAVNETLLNELVQVCEAIERDDGINVVILTGAGKAFSAGRELTGILEGKEEPGGPRYRALENLSKPVIAAINGYCFTGSLELMMCADIVVASERARFCDTHARFGIVPGGGQTQRLPRIVGVRKAKELLFTCRPITATEAERIGMVNRVVAHEQLMDTAREIANAILENVPETVREIKALINQSLKTDLEEGLRIEASKHQGAISINDEGKKRVAEFIALRAEKKRD